MPFKKGKSGNPKGCPKGAHHKGRPTNEFKDLCAEALEEVEGINFVKSMIAGVKFDSPFGLSAAKPETRFEGVKWLAERAHGKTAQPLEHSGKDGEPLKITIVNYA